MTNIDDLKMTVFLIGYRMKCSNQRSLISINSSFLNSTHFSVDMGTVDMNTVTQLDFSVLFINRTAIMKDYVNYVDITLLNIVGSTMIPLTPLIPSEQYLFRNQIGGIKHIHYNLSSNLSAVFGYYYFNSTASDSFYIWSNFIHRKRVCPLN